MKYIPRGTELRCRNGHLWAKARIDIRRDSGVIRAEHLVLYQEFNKGDPLICKKCAVPLLNNIYMYAKELEEDGAKNIGDISG